MKKYSEEIVRYEAIDDEGYRREILERITWERVLLADGTLGEPSVFNRRFDLQTGEPLNRLGDGEFEVEATGARLQLQR
jgi:hypothetical protein